MNNVIYTTLITVIGTIITTLLAAYFKLIEIKMNTKSNKTKTIDRKSIENLHSNILYTDAVYWLDFKINTISFCKDDADKDFIYKTILEEKIKAIVEISKELIHSKNYEVSRGQLNINIKNNAKKIIDRYNASVLSIFCEKYINRSVKLFNYVMNDEKVGFNTVFHANTVEYLLLCVDDFCNSNNGFDNNIEIIDEVLKLYRNAIAIAIAHCEKSVEATNGTIKKIVNYE